MRWPFRRRGGDEANSPSTPDTVPTAPVSRPDGRQWRMLPPLPVVVGRVAPLVSGPPPVLPPLLAGRRVSGPAVAPAVGRVEGLTTVVAQRPEPLERTVAPPPAPARPLVHRRGVPGPAAAPSAMVEATGSFVGEAREPATPHRAPGWMRYVPEWMNQSAAAEPEPAPVSRPKPPPKPVERPLPPANQPRRPNLGQSRRLGLGAPLKHAPESAAADVITPEAVVDDAEDEPPPAPLPSHQTPVTSPSTPPVVSVRPPESVVRKPAAVPLTYRSAPDRPADPTGPRPRPTRPIPESDERAASRSQPTAPRLPEQVAPRSQPLAPRPPEQVATRSPSVESGPVRESTGPPHADHPLVERPRPSPKPVSGHVPPDLAAGLRGPHRVDVSSIPVHRGPEVSVEARALGARAFTRGGEVYLPAEAGPLDTPKARGLLAHELVHAVQQRTLGTTLPAAHTPAGQALEAEAVAAEVVHAAPAPLVHPSLTQVIGQAARTVGVQLAPVAAPPAPVAPAPPPAPPSTPAPVAIAEPSPPTPAEIDLLTESRAIRTLEEWTAPTPGEEQVIELEEPSLGRSQQDRAMAEQILQVINVERAQSGEPVLNTLDANAMDLIRRTIAEQTEDAAVRSVIFAQAVAAGGDRPDPAVAQPARQPADRVDLTLPLMAPVPVEGVDSVVPQPVPVVLPPPEPAPVVAATDPSDQPIEIERLDLEQLTARLYDRLRNRIRMELLIDRERAGLLTDFR